MLLTIAIHPTDDVHPTNLRTPMMGFPPLEAAKQFPLMGFLLLGGLSLHSADGIFPT